MEPNNATPQHSVTAARFEGRRRHENGSWLPWAPIHADNADEAREWADYTGEWRAVEQHSVTFPERDQSKPAEQQGLFRKFDVRRVDGSDQPGGKHYGCRYYVLDLNHDQHAPAAMRAYGEACRTTHPLLAADIVAEFGAQHSVTEQADFPAGAIHNGEAFATRLENIYDFQCEAGPLRNCNEWIELRRCINVLVDYAQARASTAAPLDMVLHCPACGLQHIDALDERTADWKNEPHRSHLCHGCAHIWRPADVPTNGVKAITTRGKNDRPAASTAATQPEQARDWFNGSEDCDGNPLVLIRADELKAAVQFIAINSLASHRIGGDMLSRSEFAERLAARAALAIPASTAARQFSPEMIAVVQARLLAAGCKRVDDTASTAASEQPTICVSSCFYGDCPPCVAAGLRPGAADQRGDTNKKGTTNADESS